jgi:type IV pilus biogenesis protein PilP
MQSKSIQGIEWFVVACVATLAASASPGVQAAPQTPAVAASAAVAPAPAPAPAAAAQIDPPSPEAAATVAALTRLEGETVVLKAELKKLETQTQIAQRAAELNRLNGAGAPDEVRVRAVEGLGNKLFATLESRSAGEFEVKAGDTLPNGMKIVSIKPNAVYAQLRGGAKVQLPRVVSWDASSYAGAPESNTASFPPLPRN